jgi:hypothetical protein
MIVQYAVEKADDKGPGAMREEGEHGEYGTYEQRSLPGWIGVRMPPYL